MACVVVVGKFYVKTLIHSKYVDHNIEFNNALRTCLIFFDFITINQCMYTISSTKLVATISDNVYYSNCQKEYNLSKYITCLYTYTCVMR